MKTIQNYAIFPDEYKSSILYDEDTDAWVYISGKPEQKEDPRSYYKIIPTLYRGVDKRAKAVANMPFTLYKGETEFDTSADWQNKVGLIPSMYALLWVIEAGLTLAGKAYLKQEKNQAEYAKLLRHLDPTSVELDQEKAKKGEIVFKRKDMTYKPGEIVYFWYPDPYIEIGPPSSSPAGTALNACGVLANIDEFAKKYFARGAIKAMLFAAEGMPKGEAEKFESWWQKFVGGVKNAFSTRVLNAAKMTPVVVGEGIKELEDTTVTQEKREEIAAALDIPFAILFSNAANYATAQQDKRNWIEDFVKPECNFIAGVLNEQLFADLGLRLEFQPESLSVMQEDESQRASALKALTDSNVPLLMAMDILGYELTDEQRAELEQAEADAEAQAEELRQRLANAAQQPPSQTGQEQPGNTPRMAQEGQREAQMGDKGKSIDTQALGRELSIWQAKCIAALKRGEAADSVPFVPVVISREAYSRIGLRLKECKTAEEVKGVFAQDWDLPPVKHDGLALIAVELKRANDLLEATKE